jgi:hypothetical protein
MSNNIEELKIKYLEKKKELLTNKKIALNTLKDVTEKKRMFLKEDGLKLYTDLVDIPKKGYVSLDNNLNGGINKPPTIIERIKSFFKSTFFSFMKKYFIFLILIIICFYILLYINNNTKDSIIVYETKVFFYLLLIFLFIIINDILEIPEESLTKFILIILFSVLISYIFVNLIEKFYKNNTFSNNFFIIFGTTLFVYIVTLIIIYFVFYKDNQTKTNKLFNAFERSFDKNYTFLIFFTFYLYLFRLVNYYFNWNSTLTDILCPTIMGSVLLFFIFCIIIFVAYKLKVINNKQFLNTFIALFSIGVFLGFVHIYIFMESLNSICTPASTNTLEKIAFVERLVLIMIVSLVIILWLADSRNWHQIGSILFIFASFITIIALFYYSTLYPSISLLSFWLFIEWVIIIFRRKENSKNSLHFSFMKT